MSTAKLRNNAWGYGLSSPALLLFLALLVMPLGLTVLLLAGIFGAFPGVAIVVVSAIIFLTAAVGEYGARVDNKCLLLLVSAR